jgi:hypothetical protein
MPQSNSIGNKETLLILALLVFLPLLVMLMLVVHFSGGVFAYTLDDPYIHLALAEIFRVVVASTVKS